MELFFGVGLVEFFLNFFLVFLWVFFFWGGGGLSLFYSKVSEHTKRNNLPLEGRKCFI